jgi:hypothetical protein
VLQVVISRQSLSGRWDNQPSIGRGEESHRGIMGCMVSSGRREEQQARSAEVSQRPSPKDQRLAASVVWPSDPDSREPKRPPKVIRFEVDATPGLQHVMVTGDRRNSRVLYQAPAEIATLGVEANRRLSQRCYPRLAAEAGPSEQISRRLVIVGLEQHVPSRNVPLHRLSREEPEFVAVTLLQVADEGRISRRCDPNGRWSIGRVDVGSRYDRGPV